MVKVDTVTVKDLGALKDIDLKASVYTATPEMWAYAIADGHCANYGAYIGSKMVGFIITEQHDKAVQILRYKVHPDYLFVGVDVALMEKASFLARDLHVYTLYIIVPEIHCLPGDPDDESEALSGFGFRATTILKDAFDMYGRKYDGFRFERKL
jgi:hypothetical protein